MVYVIIVGKEVQQYGPFDSHDAARLWLGDENALCGLKAFIQELTPITPAL